MDDALLEAFALADDRERVLREREDGSDDVFHLRCLHLQHQRRFDEARALLARWASHFPSSRKLSEARTRLALLDPDHDWGATERLLKDRLGPRLDHQRRVEGERPRHASRIGEETLSLRKQARRIQRAQHDLGGFTDAALEELPELLQLSASERRALLGRVSLPDFPNLVPLIAATLRDRDYGCRFGDQPIHALLTQAQLEELARDRQLRLRSHPRWVEVMLLRLRPSAEERWEDEPAARERYLAALWAFVEPLEAAFDPLKAHVLYHQLAHDRAQGRRDRARLLTYLQLPHDAAYRDPRTWHHTHRNSRFTLGERDCSAQTGLPSVDSDQALIDELLAQELVEADDLRPWDAYVRADHLERLQARAKLLAGVGDAARWRAVLGQSEADRLRDEVEITFAPDNPTELAGDAPVRLAAWVKNVGTLVVKVFELNTFNVYSRHGREVDVTLDLDGLAASHEETFSYDDPPIRRVRREFDLPLLARPGTFVVELIGNGKSSRALVRKGRLRFVERCGAAGHVFTILDEAGAPAPDATLWLAGREHRPDGEGRITVPYSTRPGPQTILLRRGALTTLERFDHRGEEYRFEAAVHVPREGLVAGFEAEVWVQARLTLGEQPVALSLLEAPTLTIETTDRQGTQSTQLVHDFALRADAEAVHRFRVPEDAAEVAFTVSGRIQTMTRGSEQVSVRRELTLNGIDAAAQVDALHLARTEQGYVLQLLGKNGEPRPEVPLRLTFVHRALHGALEGTFQTDGRGRIELRALEEVTEVRATAPGGPEQRWPLVREHVRRPRALHAREGEPIELPARPGSVRSPRAVALFELRGGAPYADRFERVDLERGRWVLRGLAPGDYALTFKEEGATVAIRVSAGPRRAGWVIGATRLLEAAAGPALGVVELDVREREVRVQLVGAGKRTRVHVLGTRFLPERPPLADLALAAGRAPREAAVEWPEITYASGRELGEEHRYVLERRYAARVAGNMLARPGLLLNPWAVRDTRTGTQTARGGGAYRADAKKRRARAAPGGAPPPPPRGQAAGYVSLDFLPRPAAALANRRPDADGAVRVPREALAGMNQLHVLVVDPAHPPLYVERGLPEVDEAPRERRLVRGLDPQRHYAERQQVAVLPQGGRLVVEDVTTAKVEVYGELERVYRLFETLSSDEHLRTFRFVLDWPGLSEETKLERYSEHACHELNLFLSFKDPEFFARVVRPYLANKRHKTFVDRYLLEEDLRGYLEPWAYGRLNVVERILLARRLGGDEPDATLRHLDDRLGLLPPDAERDERLFRTAVQGSALDSGGLAAGMAQAASAVEGVFLAQAADPFGAAGFGPSGAPPVPAMAAPAPSAPPRMMAKKAAARDERAAPAMEAEEPAGDFEDVFGGFYEEDEEDEEREVAQRSEMRALFRAPDKTKELAESDYYRLPRSSHGPDLVQINPFWRDFAAHRGSGPFLSPHVAHAAGSFTEMMCALAVLGLPFRARAPEVAYEGARVTLAVPEAALIFHQQVAEAEPGETGRVLVGQHLLRADDRHRHEGGEAVEKYVTGELLTHVVYVCGVVLTNPTASTQKLDVLLQIPRGALPVDSGFTTRGLRLRLGPYQTERVEYAFYFPEPGQFAHFPVHVAQGERLVAWAEPALLEVVRTPRTVDAEAWSWISQHGTSEQVLAVLAERDLERLDLELMAWRLSDHEFFTRAIAALERRHVYRDALWAYALVHRDRARIATWLRHQSGLLLQCGAALAPGGLVEHDPEVRGGYEHLEYAPLINARAHQLGARRALLNEAFAAQWRSFLLRCVYAPELAPKDQLAAVVYLLLQDRVDEALARLARVDPAAHDQRLQHDYLRCYALFFGDDAAGARQIAERYFDYPVLRWRRLFRDVLHQLDEVAGAGAQVSDPEAREQVQGALAASEPILELEASDGALALHHQRLGRVTVSYYPVDVELLFSRQPFASQAQERFSLIRPRHAEELALEGDGTTRLTPPADLGPNLVVEVAGEGLVASTSLYASRLRVAVIERYGQVRVTHKETGAPLPRTYVKVYARMDGGEAFYKDGYTDLRGRFDYASLSTDALDRAERFALLVLHDELGAAIREAAPPKR